MVGRTGWDLLVYALSFVLDLAIAITLVPHPAPTGAAIAQTTALVVSNALRLWLVWRFVRIQPYDRYYARLLIPTAVGAVVMLAVHAVTAGPHWAVDLFATGVIGGAAYYVTLLFFGLTPEERASVVTMIAKARGHQVPAAPRDVMGNRSGSSRIGSRHAADEDALAFYRARGFTVTAIHRGAVDAARVLKPSIRLTDPRGVPIRDEIELARDLRCGATPPAGRSSRPARPR